MSALRPQPRPRFLLAAALVGCGGGGAADTGATGDGLTTGGSGSLSAYYTEYLEVLCARAARCEPAGGSAGQAACDRLRAEFETTSVPHLQTAVDDGTVVFHEADAEVCLSQLRTSPCTDAPRIEVTCGRVFTGTLYPGSPCNLPMECADGLFCDLSETCPGTCAERLAPGAACTRSAACPAPQTCFKGKCTAPAAQGQSCAGEGDRPCEAGLYCVVPPDEGATGTCRALTEISVRKGERCDPERGPYCQGALVCQFDGFEADTAVFGCVPRVGETAACTYAFPDPCPAGFFCDETNFAGGDVDGRCNALPGVGEACAVSVLYPNRECAGELVCVFGEGCQPPRHLGEACGGDDECASRRCAEGECAPADVCAEL